MKSAPENIPTEIFDWIQIISFRELNRDQQDLVLQYFTETDYSELHSVVSALRMQQGTQNRKLAVKNKLLQEFDQHYKSPTKKQFYVVSTAFYRVAAAVLFTACMGLLVWMRLGYPPAAPSLTLHDTLYLTREVAAAPVRIYDTIYLPVKGKRLLSKSNARSMDLPVLPQSPASIDVVSMSDMEEVHNRPKNNSMKDDTLLRTYSFVAL